MQTIRIRLILLFIVVTTTTLAVFGVYGHYLLAQDLEQRFQALQSETLSRLGISIPHTMWGLDVKGVRGVLHAEMLPQEILGIQVLDTKGRVFANTVRAPDGSLRDEQEFALNGAELRSSELYYRGAESDGGADNKGTLMGSVQVGFSRERMHADLRQNAWRRVLEIIVIDALLLIALVLSLRMVFRPLAQLRDALFELASHESTEVEELQDAGNNEFGEVVQGFNLTQRKLQQTMEKRRMAEAASLEAARQSEKAYEDLKAAQESLVQAERLAGLGGLVAGVAHEINTPVGIALTSASVLRAATVEFRQLVSSGAIRKSDIVNFIDAADEASQLMQSNAERAAHLIQSFKQVAVDQTSEMRREYELGAYVHEVMASLGPQLRKCKAKLHVVCAQPVPLDGYPGAMAQVLTNLTMNAFVHAFGDNGEGDVEIAARCEDDWVLLTVKDNGRGIAPEHLGKVFDPFFTTRRGQGGTGLGLNIVHNIVKKTLGGTIEVSSQLGQGVCFTLRFPCQSPAQGGA